MSFVFKTLMIEQTNTEKVKSSSISHTRARTPLYYIFAERSCAPFQLTLLFQIFGWQFRVVLRLCSFYLNVFPLNVPSFLSYCVFNILFRFGQTLCKKNILNNNKNKIENTESTVVACKLLLFLFRYRVLFLSSFIFEIVIIILLFASSLNQLGGQLDGNLILQKRSLKGAYSVYIC